MAALKLLTDLRERGVQLWIKLGARKGMLEMVEMLDRHETETADLLDAPSAAAEPRHHGSGRRQGASLRDQVIALSSVRNWRQEE
jgi:hypothetical protein